MTKIRRMNAARWPAGAAEGMGLDPSEITEIGTPKQSDYTGVPIPAILTELILASERKQASGEWRNRATIDMCLSYG